MTHVHEWTDAPDDESAWFCPGCGVTECGRCPYDPDAIRREAYEKVRAALTDEDEIAHGEAVVERNGRLLEMNVCAYCQSEWPCRTQRGIDRLLAAIDTLMGDDDGR